MEMTEEKLLEKILLPVNKGWEVTEVSVDEDQQEIHVQLRYILKSIEVVDTHFPIFDFREERSWRHLDLWHYKTFLHARVPRYKEGDSYKTAPVPWADAVERMSFLLEKKR